MPEHYIGLISGTSIDAVDAVLLAVGPDERPTLVATHAEPPPAALRAELLRLSAEDVAIPPRRFGELDQWTGHWFAQAAEALIAKAGVSRSDIRAVGSHGQTLYHATEPTPFSLQIGDPNRIAARTGLTTIADFRRADMAVGGQGAPLVPAFHHTAFADDREPRCVVNLGGIANVTVLPDRDAARVTGFDTGPANALLDDWVHAHLGAPRDDGGQWASQGQPDEALLAGMLADPYFDKPPPKSTGRETFNLDWIRRHLHATGAHLSAVDVQRTLAELTARSLCAAITAHASATERVFVCGGGVHNRLLITRLQALLAPRRVDTTAALGIEPDWVEGAAFAWLAMRTLHGRPGNLPSVTGARHSVVLGGVYDPRGPGVRREA